MSMNEWAKREVEIACKRENPNRKDGEFCYGCACYESALKAFESLCGDGHSGFSIKMTQRILNSLIDGRPLTPIEDTEDIWEDVSYMGVLNGEKSSYQCKRMSSLFKYVYEDGVINYKDLNRSCGIDINNNTSYHSGLITRIIDEMFPIKMPYMPDAKPIKVYSEDFLTNKDNGDFDTVGTLYAIKGEEKVEINRYFKESQSGWIEISKEEYEQRKENKIK